MENKRDNLALVFSVIAMIISIVAAMYFITGPKQDISGIRENSNSINVLNNDVYSIGTEIYNIQNDIKNMKNSKVDSAVINRLSKSEDNIVKLQKFKTYIRNCADDNYDFDDFRSCINEY